MRIFTWNLTTFYSIFPKKLRQSRNDRKDQWIIKCDQLLNFYNKSDLFAVQQPSIQLSSKMLQEKAWCFVQPLLLYN